MAAKQEVVLGAHTYSVRPQKVGYLINKLGPRLQEALEAEVEGLDGAALVGAKAHDVLSVFIPSLMPLHEFLGFASEEAMKAGVYEEEADHSPEPLQIKEAFAAASNVNGGEVLKHLKALLGPVLTERLSAAVVAAMAEQSQSSPSTISALSPTSPPMSGASDSTSSGTSPQTPTLSAV